MIVIAGLVLPFFGLIALGALTTVAMRRHHSTMAGEAGLFWLNAFIVYIALPALFFKLLSRTPIHELTRFDFIVTTLGATYCLFAVIFIVGRLLRAASISEAIIQGLAAAYGNIGFMGPGLALAAFGERAAVPVALIFCFENVAHFIAAPALMALDRREGAQIAVLVASIARRVLLHPFILSTAVGVAAAALSWQPPLAVQRLIDSLAPAAAPCALFSMGVSLALRPLKRVPVELGYIVPAKLLLHPLLMLLALRLAGPFDPVWVRTAVLMAALPSAANVFVLAQHYNVWRERASAAVLISTVLSVASITLVLTLVASGWMPL